LGYPSGASDEALYYFHENHKGIGLKLEFLPGIDELRVTPSWNEDLPDSSKVAFSLAEIMTVAELNLGEIFGL